MRELEAEVEFPTEMIDAILAIANANNITFSQAIGQLIRAGLKAREKK